MQGAEMAFRRRESMRLFEELVGLLPERPDRLPDVSRWG